MSDIIEDQIYSGLMDLGYSREAAHLRFRERIAILSDSLVTVIAAPVHHNDEDDVDFFIEITEIHPTGRCLFITQHERRWGKWHQKCASVWVGSAPESQQAPSIQRRHYLSAVQPMPELPHQTVFTPDEAMDSLSQDEEIQEAARKLMLNHKCTIFEGMDIFSVVALAKENPYHGKP